MQLMLDNFEKLKALFFFLVAQQKLKALTWAKAGRTGLAVLSRNPLQSPIANTSCTEGTRSHSSMPILQQEDLSLITPNSCQTSIN